MSYVYLLKYIWRIFHDSIEKDYREVPNSIYQPIQNDNTLYKEFMQ